MRSKWGIIIFCVVAFFCIFVVYRDLPNIFFQQDEWMSMGLVLGRGILGGIAEKNLFSLLGGTERILGSLLNNSYYYFFGIRVFPFVVTGIIVHFANTILVFLLLRRITKNDWVAGASGLFFAVGHAHHQALTWIAANTTVLPSAFFSLSSLYLFIPGVQKDSKRFLLWPYILGIISFYFKETGITTFFLFPIMELLWGRHHRIFWKRHIPVFGFIILAIIVRVLTMTGSGYQGVFAEDDSSIAVKLLTRAFMYPFTSFSQMFIPPHIIFAFAKRVSQLPYGFLHNGPEAESTITFGIMDILSLTASAILLVGIWVVNLLEKKSSKTLLFGVIVALISFLPFVVIDRPMSPYLESRYFYCGMIGAAIIMAGVWDWIYKYVRRHRYALGFWMLLVVLYAGFLVKNGIFIKREIRLQTIAGEERRRLLRSFAAHYPRLPVNPIIYLTGDSPGFYGLADVVVPLQQGPGYTLMVWYAKTGVIPRQLLSQGYLWGIYDQGYKEVNGLGFGYFFDKTKLKEEYRSNPKLKPDQVVGLLYRASDKQLLDITDDIRGYIRL